MACVPTEVWSQIAEYLPADALDATSATSKDLRRMLSSSPAMKRHGNLKAKYNRCICGRGQSHGPISELAVQVFLYPELSYYIQSLTIMEWSNHVQLNDWRVYRHIVPTSYQDTLDAGLKGRQFLEEQLRWFECQSGIFVLLLWTLSELRELQLVGPSTRARELGVVMDEAQGIGYKPFGPPSPPMLPKLKRTNFEGKWPKRTIAAFAGLATVEEIAAPGDHGDPNG